MVEPEREGPTNDPKLTDEQRRLIDVMAAAGDEYRARGLDELQRLLAEAEGRDPEPPR